jgi:hypothetical protein
VVNAAMYFLFTASFGLKYYTMVVVAMERQKLADVDFWRRVRDLVPSDEAAQIAVFQTFYWLNDGNLFVLFVSSLQLRIILLHVYKWIKFRAHPNLIICHLI